MTGSGLPPRGGDTLASVLRGHAARTPDAPFLAFEPEPGTVEHTSYAGQLARAERAAGALYRHGVRPGDRFGAHLTNRPEFYDLWFGAALLGAAVAPSNPLATADELGYQFEHAGCEVVVTQPDLLETVEKAGAGTVLDVTGPWVRDDDAAPEVAVDPTGPVGVLYTSGTTSRPKGVLLSHAAYLHCGDVVAGHLRLRPDDRQLVVLPLFHGNAQFYSTMSALVTGASVGLAPKFTARRFSAQAVALEATVASLFAAPIRMILAAEPSADDAAHRLRVAMFAQNVTDAQLAEFERRFAVPLVQLYGMTETVVPPLMNPLHEQRRGTAIGRPVPGVRVRVADPDENGAGELHVHGVPGHTIMTAYLDNPQATAETLEPDGAGGAWLHTGDSVRVDADGYHHFVDRRKDMIKRAGENVASGEVERVVSEHEAVFECAAVGVPDEMRDEAIEVFVVCHTDASVTEDELLAHCRERMARFKVPDHVEFVDELPRTSVGKIQKHLLRRSHR